VCVLVLSITSPGLPSNSQTPVSASQVAGIIGVNYHTWF
jgi:hypothetical protein